MKLFQLLSLFFLIVAESAQDVPVIEGCQCGIANDRKTSRIVNGKRTSPNKYPWMASLVYHSDDKWVHGCGGTIISDLNILTAAHCFQPETEHILIDDDTHWIVGMHGLYTKKFTDRYNIKDYEFHPEYHHFEKMDQSDLVITILDRRITFNWAVKPICLPPPGASYDNADAVVAGWGLGSFDNGKQPDVLMETTLQVVSTNDCDTQWSILNGGPVISKRWMICAYKEDTDSCKGDSGGPLVVNTRGFYEIIGAVSFGMFCVSAYPGVYASVTDPDTIEWIRNYFLHSAAKICEKPNPEELRRLSSLSLIKNVFGEIPLLEDCFCGKANEHELMRISNGQRTVPNKYPWMASLVHRTEEETINECGGTVISELHILSAAHCFQHPNESSVEGDETYWILGMHKINSDEGERYNIIDYDFHPEFHHFEKFDQCDLVITTVDRKITFSRTIRPVCLPAEEATFDGLEAIVAGWGIDDYDEGQLPEALMETTVTVMSAEECNEMWKEAAEGSIIDEQWMHCGFHEGTDTCKGDSGGPLVHETSLDSSEDFYELIGVTSFGLGCSAKLPAVFARIAETVTLEWINGYIENSGAAICPKPNTAPEDDPVRKLFLRRRSKQTGKGGR